jgi:bifunctional UDP-N-acetylglucosamine pyrophosphorylase/glucosamine-1-phosphate N-acetyltransferase
MIKLTAFEGAALVKQVDDPSQYGVYAVDSTNRVLNLVEKPKTFIGTLTNIGCYIFDREIFVDLKSMPLSERGEYELTTAILSLARRKAFYVCPIEGFWLTNGFPWELLPTQEFFMKQMNESSIKGEVEPGAVLKGHIEIGEGTLVKAGSYLEGPVVIGKNCLIGPNCFIRRYTSIGDNCRIGHAVEIKNSIIMANTNVCHLSYVGDSVIGSEVNLGAGFISANVRHDQQNVLSSVKGKLFDTGMNKFGTIIADGVHTGVHTSVLPGRKIWPNQTTYPGQVVEKDIVGEIA